MWCVFHSNHPISSNTTLPIPPIQSNNGVCFEDVWLFNTLNQPTPTKHNSISLIRVIKPFIILFSQLSSPFLSSSFSINPHSHHHHINLSLHTPQITLLFTSISSIHNMVLPFGEGGFCLQTNESTKWTTSSHTHIHHSTKQCLNNTHIISFHTTSLSLSLHTHTTSTSLSTPSLPTL